MNSGYLIALIKCDYYISKLEHKMGLIFNVYLLSKTTFGPLSGFVHALGTSETAHRLSRHLAYTEKILESPGCVEIAGSSNRRDFLFLPYFIGANFREY